MKRYNVNQAKEVPGRDKPVWIKHGVAFEKDGKLRVKLESIPIPNRDGDIWLSLFDADTSESHQNGPGRSQSSQGNPTPSGERYGAHKRDTSFDDDIPF
jgi:hypothetical protein